jgi:hypothetical protein
MKIKVINKGLPLYDRELKVKSLNFDMAVIEENGQAKALGMDDIELIPETKYEEFILSHKDLLKIKLNNEISPLLYTVLTDYIEERINSKLEGLEVLEDSYKLSKRGIWEKRLVIVVNNAVPLEVSIAAAKYSESFSITLKDISLKAFIEGCSEGMTSIKKEIEEKQKSLERYKNTLKKVLSNSISIDEEYMGHMIEGA